MHNAQRLERLEREVTSGGVLSNSQRTGIDNVNQIFHLNSIFFIKSFTMVYF